MIDAGMAAARLTAVLRTAMTHGNKIRPSAIAPGHRRIPDFSPSFQAVYSSDRRLPSTTVRGEEASDGFRRGERVVVGPMIALGWAGWSGAGVRSSAKIGRSCGGVSPTSRSAASPTG